MPVAHGVGATGAGAPVKISALLWAGGVVSCPDVHALALLTSGHEIRPGVVSCPDQARLQ